VIEKHYLSKFHKSQKDGLIGTWFPVRPKENN